MAEYVVNHRYRSGEYGPWDAGVVLELDGAVAEWVNNDSPGVLSAVADVAPEPAQPPAVEPPAEDPPLDEPPADEPPAEDPSGEDPPPPAPPADDPRLPAKTRPHKGATR